MRPFFSEDAVAVFPAASARNAQRRTDFLPLESYTYSYTPIFFQTFRSNTLA